MERFVDRVAVVTGGDSGIGEAAVQAFFAEGASIVVVDSNEQAAKHVADGLGDPKRVYPVAVDVSDREALDRVFVDAAERFGKLDILVNCAAIRGVATVLEVDPDQWRRVHAVNLEGTLNAIQSFARLISKAQGSTAIVNITSIGGIMGVPNRAAYVSSKHAVVGLTRELAIEVGTAGIRVNAVAPGMIRTPMTEVMFQEPEGERRIRASHPIGREGRPEEIAAAILFLASDDASFITGAILPVDGGYSAGRGW